MSRKPTILIGEDKQFLVDIIKESFGSGFNCICVRTEEKVFENLDSADAVVVGLDVCPREQEERVKMISEKGKERHPSDGSDKPPVFFGQN